jgi:hypothetical protein
MGSRRAGETACKNPSQPIPIAGQESVITDEQAHEKGPAPSGKGYVINVTSYKNSAPV